MVASSALGLEVWPSVIISVALAFVFGYSLAMRPILGAGLPWRRAARVAVASDTASITTMEIMDNSFMMAVPGAITAGLGSGLFWLSLGLSLVVAFVVTVPVNRWLIARGLGHALVHQYHHDDHSSHHHPTQGGHHG